jgi:hypothetical protein
MDNPWVYVHYPSLVFNLRKSLYGLKKAPRAWYAKMDSYLLYRGFIICISDPNVYMMRKTYYLLLIVLYVDNLIVIGISSSSIVVVKTALHHMFSMIDMGLLH